MELGGVMISMRALVWLSSVFVWCLIFKIVLSVLCFGWTGDCLNRFGRPTTLMAGLVVFGRRLQVGALSSYHTTPCSITASEIKRVLHLDQSNDFGVRLQVGPLSLFLYY